MKKKLTDLQEALCMVETRGESTLIMADCIKFLGDLIMEVPEPADPAVERDK